jgi:hypothetical protein
MIHEKKVIDLVLDVVFHTGISLFIMLSFPESLPLQVSYRLFCVIEVFEKDPFLKNIVDNV